MADEARALSENDLCFGEFWKVNLFPLPSFLRQLRYLHEMIKQDIPSWLPIVTPPRFKLRALFGINLNNMTPQRPTC